MTSVRTHDLPVVTCANCRACCCQLEVMLMGDDDPPAAMIEEDRWGGQVMRRLDDGWCQALDRQTMRCTIYERRPTICRDFEEGGYECREERRRSLPEVIEVRHLPGELEDGGVDGKTPCAPGRRPII